MGSADTTVAPFSRPPIRCRDYELSFLPAASFTSLGGDSRARGTSALGLRRDPRPPLLRPAATVGDSIFACWRLRLLGEGWSSRVGGERDLGARAHETAAQVRGRRGQHPACGSTATALVSPSFTSLGGDSRARGTTALGLRRDPRAPLLRRAATVRDSIFACWRLRLLGRAPPCRWHAGRTVQFRADVQTGTEPRPAVPLDRADPPLWLAHKDIHRPRGACRPCRGAPEHHRDSGCDRSHGAA
jgi:hypothetical protein